MPLNQVEDMPASVVFGGSGFVGGHLLRRLLARGERVVSIDIRPPATKLEGVAYLHADVRDLSELHISSIGKIYNLAAVHTTPGHEDHEYYDTNVNGALEVTRFAERGGARQIIFTSSISVYGPSEDKKDESSRPEPSSPYGKSKLMAEKIHRNWQVGAPERSLVVVRPAVVFGRGEGGNFARMAALLKRGFFVFPGRRDTIKSCIHVDDLIDLILEASRTNEGSVLFNGAYPDCPTLEKIVTRLQSEFFPKARLIDVPAPVVIGLAKILKMFSGVGLGIHPDRVNKLMRSTFVYPKWAVERGLLSLGDFDKGISRWASSTDGTFV